MKSAISRKLATVYHFSKFSFWRARKPPQAKAIAVLHRRRREGGGGGEVQNPDRGTHTTLLLIITDFNFDFLFYLLGVCDMCCPYTSGPVMIEAL